MTTAFGLDAWEGDPDNLRGAEDRLTNDPELCDRTFESKNEAFATGLHLGARPGTLDDRHTRTSAILKVIDETPWGGIADALQVIDEALAVAMTASRDGLRYWENNINESPWDDEFSVLDPSSLSPEWRIALLARLLRTIAMAYGLGTDYDERIGAVIPDDDSAATPIRRMILAVLSPAPDTDRA